MTDKEKIKAEIERLNKEWRLCDSAEGKYRCETYRELLQFIDSLPEEPVSKDLEEAARKAATFHSRISGDKFIQNDYWFFRKGAQWQKEQTINKACEWLEHNAHKYIIEHPFPLISDADFEEDELINDFRKAMEDEK